MKPHIEVDDALLSGWPLPLPEADCDKEGRGRVLIVAGSPEIPGAAVLSGIAALRAGAGKLAVATTRSAWPIVAAALPEARVIPLDETPEGGPAPGVVEQLCKVAESASAVLIGPGMMDTAATVELVHALMPRCGDGALILDALAMDAVRDGMRHRRPFALTPHAGEMAHLTGERKEDIEDDPRNAVVRHANAWGATVALKGAATWVATPEGELWRHEMHAPGLATSGSGDVLAGVIAGLAARGATLEQAVVWGVALHARAGLALAERHGMVGFLARELAGEIPLLMR
ncbi:NAD(P)H-hydrate dehydratase [Ramlibacter sp.]|uniref:NAD(P)H-hydrate dehydratase n=1 Tax=Ramlibacter sp. TaxID=1917967 RepID=UPI003D0EA2A1